MSNLSNPQAISQRRATHAWNAVRNAKQKTGPHKPQDPKKFGGHVKRMSSRIITAGLGQALVFIKSKDEAPGLIAELSDWVIKHRFALDDESSDLLERLLTNDAMFLRRATDETLAYLVWLKRFSDAEKLTDNSSAESASP